MEIAEQQVGQERPRNSDKKKIPKEPQLYPDLRKNVLNLDKFIESQSKKKLGSFGISLDNLRKKSIYKMLLVDIKKGHNNADYRGVRNDYLKKLVESNTFYFPKELALDEFKKPNNPKVDKYNKYLNFMEEVAKKDKNLKTNQNSNKNSRSGSFLENKRKRTESIYEVVNKRKKKKKKKKEVNEEENDENEEDNYLEENDRDPSYNNNNDEEEYGQDDDSQNLNYDSDYGGDDDY